MANFLGLKLASVSPPHDGLLGTKDMFGVSPVWKVKLQYGV